MEVASRARSWKHVSVISKKAVGSSCCLWVSLASHKLNMRRRKRHRIAFGAGRRVVGGQTGIGGAPVVPGDMSDPRGRKTSQRQRERTAHPICVHRTEYFLCLWYDRSCAAPSTRQTSDHLFPIWESDRDPVVPRQVGRLLATGNIQVETLEALHALPHCASQMAASGVLLWAP